MDHTLAKIQPEAVWENVLIAESSWSYANKSSYKKALREVKKNYTRFKGQANKLKASVEENFSEDKQNAKFVESVLAAGTSAEQPNTGQVVTL